MISRVHSSILYGIHAVACEVEADVAVGGQGELKLVVLPDQSVKESVSRIQAALRAAGHGEPGASHAHAAILGRSFLGRSGQRVLQYAGGAA
jgi:hypothetical protein